MLCVVHTVVFGQADQSSDCSACVHRTTGLVSLLSGIYIPSSHSRWSGRHMHDGGY